MLLETVNNVNMFNIDVYPHIIFIGRLYKCHFFTLYILQKSYLYVISLDVFYSYKDKVIINVMSIVTTCSGFPCHILFDS